MARVTNKDFALAAKPLNAVPNPVTPEVAEAAEEPMSTISSEMSTPSARPLVDVTISSIASLYFSVPSFAADSRSSMVDCLSFLLFLREFPISS